MITLLSKWFIKDRQQYTDTKVRTAYGMICSIVGICLNIFLFIIKYIAGSLSSSVAITADSFNNLSDSASSFITLIGFKLSEQKPHSDHPFGHGRFEYISGLLVSFMILFMGLEVGKASIGKIINPEQTQLSYITVIILLSSIAVKLYMFIYNNSIGKKIDSAGMKATAYDCFGDMASTAVVLISTFISHYFEINIDGWCGLLVTGFIIYSGIKSALETINPLLGQPPSPEFVKQVEDIVRSHHEIIGIHDLIVHDYGPGRRMISLHGEMPGSMNVMEMHDIIDRIEAELLSQLGCEAVIHMDPVDTDNPLLDSITSSLHRIISDIDGTITFHDLRIVTGPTHTNIIFDILIPPDCKMTDTAVLSTIREAISTEYGTNYFCVIKPDRAYI